MKDIAEGTGVPAMPQRPQVIAFDVIGTLFSLDGLRPCLAEAGLPERALDLWFARLLRDAFALDAAGVYVPFRQVAAGALQVIFAEHQLEAGTDRLARVLDGFAQLDPHTDVAPALRAAREAGVRVVLLTNGSAETTRALVQRAGLEGDVERYISIDDVRHWKPRPEVYRHAARVVGVEPSALGLVAAHAWDIAGARQAGLVTGWVGRLERRFQPALGAPDVQGATLDEVVAALLALPRS